VNLLLLDPAELAADGAVRLDDRRAAHLLTVLRATRGTRLQAGVLGGAMGEAEVVEVESPAVTLRVRLDRDPPPPSPVSLILGLPRPKALRRVLQGVAAAGVKQLLLLGSWRVERSYFGSPLLEPAALGAELRLGLEQGRDTVLPEVRVRRLFKPFVEDELDPLFPAGERLLAHELATAPLDALLAPGGGRGAPDAGRGGAVLAVGPEGGFTPYETGMLEARGFRSFSLGPRALRVEAAVPYALGQLELWLRGRAARAREGSQPVR
jgi:RsmE family RNA methyltransferase